jgi:hypothetical protein
VRIPIGTEKGLHGVCLGDWDGDGRIDIFTCSGHNNHLWHNLGGGKFSDAVDLAGSVEYIAKRDGMFVQATDFNSVGRQGLLILYAANLAPQLFFNRGFRVFGPDW